MEIKNGLILNRIFTRNTFAELLRSNKASIYSLVVEKYIENAQDKNNHEIICELYNLLRLYYQNEYYYKNTLIKKLLLGVHNLNTTTALSEITINKSKADFVLINGIATVYEIKTGLDNLDRLKSQINDYYKAFARVCIVTCNGNFSAVSKFITDTGIGLYILTERNQLSTKQKPIDNYSMLDTSIMFKTLRKKEYESILKKVYGCLPSTTQFLYYKECKDLFSKIDTKDAYNLYLKELKNRNRIDTDLYNTIPNELKTIFYFSNFSKKDCNKLDNFLKCKYGG